MTAMITLIVTPVTGNGKTHFYPHRADQPFHTTNGQAAICGAQPDLTGQVRVGESEDTDNLTIEALDTHRLGQESAVCVRCANRYKSLIMANERDMVGAR